MAAKRIITNEEIEKIIALNDSVRGTSEYAKYYMYSESKYLNDGKWSNWCAGGWANKIFVNKLTVKKVRDKIYLVSEPYKICNHTYMDRYEVTDTIKEVLGL